MSKSWQDVEFLDFKERQQRFREGGSGGPAGRGRASWARSLRVIGAIAVVALAVTGVSVLVSRVQENRDRDRRTFEAAQRRLEVTGADPGVQVQRGAGDWETVATGEALEGELCVRTGPDQRMTLGTALEGSKLVLLPGTTMRLEPVRVDAARPEFLQVQARLEGGAVLAVMSSGAPRLEVGLPSGSRVRGSRGTYRVDLTESGATVMVKTGLVLVLDREGTRQQEVRAQERLEVAGDGSWGTARGFVAPESTWAVGR